MKRKFKVARIDDTGGSADLTIEARELAKVNAEVVGFDCVTDDEKIEAAKDADAILTLTAYITRRVIEAAPKCQVIARYGIGYEKVDVDAATDNGILVVNVPDFCWEEVSNHAIVLFLACAKKLVLLDKFTRRGGWTDWAESRDIISPMVSIHGQTLGVIGCGNIGRTTAKKAQCFKLSVLGYDPYVDKSLAKESGITLVSLPELLKKSDFVSISALLSEETRHLIGEKELKQMKPTAYLINTARGGIVDEPALVKALQEKWIAGAGLDVFEKEPVDPNNPLFKMDNVTVTPHSAAASDAALERVRISVGQEVARVFSGQWPKNVVNKTVKPKINLVKAD